MNCDRGKRTACCCCCFLFLLCLVQKVWAFDVNGELGYSYFALHGARMAPNGLSFDPVFKFHTHLNLDLTANTRIYTESAFWGERAGPSTNSHQGYFDFSKREFDILVGVSRKIGLFEIGAYAYSFNNINRGNNNERPSGFKDGFAVDLMYSLERDISLGGGYYLTKELVDLSGESFKPGAFLEFDAKKMPFSRDFFGYLNTKMIMDKSDFKPRLVNADLGLGYNIWKDVDLKLGCEVDWDIPNSKSDKRPYVGVQVNF